MKLQNYRPEDAALIVRWASSEQELRQWTADRFAEEPWPLSGEAFDAGYRGRSADCLPLTALEGGRPVGHVFVRRISGEPDTCRLGFIIVDPGCRGQGAGRKLVKLACCKAVEVFGAKRITLGVFENNPRAEQCYRTMGFTRCGEKAMEINGERWRCFEMEYQVPV